MLAQVGDPVGIPYSICIAYNLHCEGGTACSFGRELKFVWYGTPLYSALSSPALYLTVTIDDNMHSRGDSDGLMGTPISLLHHITHRYLQMPQSQSRSADSHSHASQGLGTGAWFPDIKPLQVII